MCDYNLVERKQGNIFHCKMLEISTPTKANYTSKLLQFGSPSTIIIPRSLLTQSTAISSPSSELPKMPPCMIPLMHSYKRDMAGVVLIIDVKGGKSFLIRRGSKGVSVAN
jgi:hypothetical protein